MIIGIDEVGRGPLAGPVTVCACIFKKPIDTAFLKGLRDSKKLSLKLREAWKEKLLTHPDIDFAITSINNKVIDTKGIAYAIRFALHKNLELLKAKHVFREDQVEVWLDGGLKAPEVYTQQTTVIKGDDKIPVISAASIYAKVFRDTYMTRLAKKYPAYGLEVHKGYGTASHRRIIQKQGISPIHRRSFCKNIKGVL